MRQKKESIYHLHFADGEVIPCTIHFSDKKNISIQVKEDATVGDDKGSSAGKQGFDALLHQKLRLGVNT